MLTMFLAAFLLQGSGPPAPPQVADAASLLRIGTWFEGTSVSRSSWTTFGNGPSHTGYFPDVVLTEELAPSWTASLPGNLQQVAVADGRVYATPWQYFGDAWLAAVDEETGASLWSYSFANCYSINPPTFDGGKVYVQRGDHGSDTHLWSFHADTGVPF